MLGAHSGIIHFTVGQRRGLGLATGAPLYVVRLDAERRRVVVGPREALRTSRIVLRDVNWIGDGSIEEALGDDRREVFVKVRSTRPPQAGWLRPANGGYEVELVDGEDGVSPGQACVFYDAGEGQARVLGGGFIKSAVAATDAPQRPSAPHGGGRRAQLDLRAWGTTSTKHSVERAYARWAPVYDLVFGAVFERGRRAAIAAAEGGSADAFSKSASAPGFRCRTMRARTGWSASTCPSRCCARRRSASPSRSSANVEALAVMDAERLALAGQVLRRGGGAIRHHRGAAIRKRRSTNSRASSSRAARSCWSITSAPKPGRAPVRAMVCAAGAPARLAAGISASTG